MYPITSEGNTKYMNYYVPIKEKDGDDEDDGTSPCKKSTYEK